MKSKKFYLLVVLSLIFASCSNRKNVVMSSYSAAESLSIAPRASGAKMMKMASNDVVYEESAMDSAPSYSDESSGITAGYEKKLKKTGNVSLEVENLDDAVSKIESWTESLGGYVANSSSSEMNAWFTLKIPSSKFEDAMSQTGNFGKVLNHSENTEDVSEQYYDLKSRIENKKVMKEKLENYLKAAKDIKDLLQIEKELNSVISEIDSMEGRLKRLSNQIDYSTISINISLPANRDEHGFIFPDISSGFSNFISSFINFILGFVRVFFMIILCGIPILAAVAFFYWLLLGRCGLLIKLYKVLKEKGKNEE